MYGDKIKSLDNYIQRLDSVITSNDYTAAQRLQNEVIAVFRPEIEGITDQLESYNCYDENHRIDYISNARLLKALLMNYRINLSSGLFHSLKNGNDKVQVSQNINQSVTTNVEVTFDGTISIINSLPSDVLRDEEKVYLSGMLATISAAPDTPTRWERVKNALTWIAEKSIEVGTAALPYIVEALKK